MTTMTAPGAGAFLKFEARSGTLYTSSASGLIAGVTPLDVLDLLAAGCTLAPVPGAVGTPGTGVTAEEWGDAFDHTTVLSVATVLGAIAGGASLGLGVKVYTLPAGAQIIRAANFSMAITQSQGHINADTPTVGLGTTVASGAVAVLSGTAAFQNVGVGKAAANCTGTPTVQTSLATASPFGLVTEAGGAKDIYFNAAFAWAASGDAAAILAGTITLNWRKMA